MQGTKTILERSRPIGALLAVALVAASSVPLAGTAQDDDSTETQKCVSLRRIDHTKVVDDDTILFYLKGDQVLRNDLPRRCPALMSEDTFMYRTSVEQLCDSDTVTVLQDMGFGFIPGATCGLGEFQPITQDEADALEDRAD